MKPRPRTAHLHFLAFALFLCLRPAAAQEGAIVTADASALGAGIVEFSWGAEYLVKEESWESVAGQPAPPDPDLRRLIRLLPVSVRAGVSGNVDVIVTWRGRLLARTGGDATYRDWGDPSIFTKITFTDTGGPSAAGIFFGVKLPSSRYLPARLGSDAMDACFLATFSHRFARAEVRANAGLGIVGDPRSTGSQDDVFTGSAFALWRPIDAGALFAELFGFTGPKEGDDKLQLRGGASLEAAFGTVSLYGLGRVAGNRYDYSTAFLGTAQWGIGASVSHRFGP